MPPRRRSVTLGFLAPAVAKGAVTVNLVRLEHGTAWLVVRSGVVLLSDDVANPTLVRLRG